jgi:Carboxypeptidase regulatory-like domain
MWAGAKLAPIIILCFLGALNVCASGQTQISGRIAGTVRDAQGAMIAGADVVVQNPATADKHSVVTDGFGSYSISQLV